MWCTTATSCIFASTSEPNRAQLQSGDIANRTFATLEASAGCGLLDRLIAGDYRRAELTTLTLDRKMAALLQARRL